MIAAALSLVFGVALGIALGWWAHAARSAAVVAGARAEVEMLRGSREDVASSLSWATEDAARRQSTAIGSQVQHIVEPLRANLAQLAEELRRVESNRIGAYAGLSEQVRGIQAASLALNDQTRQLANALHSSHVRGRWGEVQLERVVELAGMTKHCDFSTQVSVKDRGPNGSGHNGSGSGGSGGLNGSGTSTLRPDLVVHLAGGRDIVVDAKVPLDAYLRAAEATDPATRDRLIGEHARALRSHIARLSAKAYWTAFDNTPEMVVLFLPGDVVLEAAARTDPDLLEYGFARNVVIATPTTLIALLRTVALGWRHDAMARDAAVIHDLGLQLHQRLAGVLGHLGTLGTSLQRTVDAYNSTIGSVESRLGVTARRLAELDALGDVADPPEPPVIHDTCRSAGTFAAPAATTAPEPAPRPAGGTISVDEPVP
ncbi:DNA recombination protein RmuC [Gordonia sp. zg691]|uniref:DNA recombination protein RmuC n=1 Tax=Gordonia jinghuaiqii TaxID=2758710 RepID=A0A7D7R904_9ACTN|nr:DNA recombination protein RmuC [Gordonia jinghuaiqii]MBD0859659.1 DNA recombination protein RmuC [Gordonia jinghuaiqii]MCR5976883.1 DNA recombination protein RmuC [Gordonia jinghuaiqii]QMT00490.1 DNA recombination protein RmuC [Gordonia jinghuaiqii]